MATHASADSDTSTVYYSLTNSDQKKIINAQKRKAIEQIVKSKLNEGYVIENIVVDQIIIEEGGRYHYINVKI